MPGENYLHSLKRKHQELEKAIHTESQRPKPDEAAIASMKKEKLHIKDLMAANQ